MRTHHRVTFFVCIATMTASALIVGLVFQHQVSEKVAIHLFGPPLYIYLAGARQLHAGKIFNIISMLFIFFTYLAVLFSPSYYILRSFKWRLVVIQTTFILIHLLVGAIMTM